ncbi:MAG TPA: bifunctional riboflavin kinase/FAD synthetase [Flavisolibacter sp.]|nr:bifunctional riboflavin kinase/FAD synthetase [Flavisolibacter sp.]
MQVHQGIEKLPQFSNSVITIGTFDGVHKGHKKIIQSLISEAEKIKGESVIITFHPHPRKIVHPGQPLQLINTLKEKIKLLSETGVDHLVIVPFNKDFSEQTADNYIEDFLVKNFEPHTITIGYDHHFGNNREGNIELLMKKSHDFGYRLLEIPKLTVDEIGVSSTKIRKAILNSEIDAANLLLGYDFFFEGLVIPGDKLGRTLGYPTANLSYTDPEKIKLGYGVYAVYVHLNNGIKKGMLSIGNRPTLTGSDEKVEVNIFDFDEDLYGKKITVAVKTFLRRQEKYNSLDELKEQLKRDKENSLSIL